MATAQTPNPVASSTMSNMALDTVVARTEPLGVTYTTAPTTTGYVVTAAYSIGASTYVPPVAGTTQFNSVTVARTVYAPITPTVVTTFVGAQSTPVWTYTQHASQAIVLTSVTQYGIAVPTVNATVWDSQNLPHALLTVDNDIVSYKAAVAVDGEA